MCGHSHITEEKTLTVRPDRPARHSRGLTRARAALSLTTAALVASTGITAIPATAATVPETATPQSTVTAAQSSLSVGTFKTFTASNGQQLKYHYFNNPGSTGTIFYFDGDGTTNFDWPTASPSNTWVDSIPGNGHVQRVNNQAKAQGMDLVFLDHPQNGRSWWNGVDGDAAATAVHQLIPATRSSRVMMVGYSGGSEFLARHLLYRNNSWLPTLSTAVMIGGGGLNDRVPSAPLSRLAGMSMVWEVGDRDIEGATSHTEWSALRVSREARNAYERAGYTQARISVIPGVNHVTYDFPQIVAKHASRLAARTLP